MVRPSESQLLEVWERGYSSAPYRRALMLLGTIYPEATVEELADWPIGQRDADLLNLRAELFGQRVETLTNCPNCQAGLELDFDVSALCDGRVAENRGSWSDQQCEVQFRVPSTRDLLAMASVSATRRRDELVRLCVEEVREAGELRAAENLSESQVMEIVKSIVEHDSLTDIRFDVNCADCEHSWSVPFDVVGFVWSEIDLWAQRVMVEIHQLATAYGWREQEILGMTAWRRRVYLNMVRQ